MGHSIHRIPDRQILVDGKPHLYFGGTAYLGLQNHPPFKDLFVQNVSKYGMHYGASRKSNVLLDIYNKTENYLANWAGSESCLTMSSGYLAAQLVVQTLIEKGHTVIAAPQAHAALCTKGVIETKGWVELEQLVSKEIAKNQLMPVVLFDTIDFSGEQFPNFKSLRSLSLDKVILIGDDSHGFGIVGENGNGCFNMLKALKPAKLMVCCSLGKALGIQAGAVFGDKKDIQMLESTPFYGGASPASPAFMATLLDAREIYSERLEKLRDNYRYFKSMLKRPSFFTHMEGHPTFEFQNTEVVSSLNKSGFVFTNFNYPDDKGPIVSRLVLSAYHKKEDVLQLTNCLNTLLG
ncbi:pyridoxal phosphate-dependent aminotransferase family protein [Flagellimonas halotolerans]|uniref:Pyridoxal phosphate-dependent aminotransferase family protein n=1 Tax=Flagellimonas halotolerans TaxID=3112164 RepID=A0ABU6IRK0_9FLAO|nr:MULTISPECIES: pyridoxal phosphate-dependent aminotransferase family protein [unclassified Allomuricauda]MEC3965905.1 pyridoxal phosphate-dependent aminotransferase family protein [Muricauda sp. SYSU M86414]MEC4265629.1 pyridoxal phosphate-dependent aminotransferase family protein [Muricauda sp. SYSU M84420]